MRRHQRVAAVDARDHGQRDRRAARTLAVDLHIGVGLAGVGCGLHEQARQFVARRTPHHGEAKRHQPGMIGRAQRGVDHALQFLVARPGLLQVLDADRLARQQGLQRGVHRLCLQAVISFALIV